MLFIARKKSLVCIFGSCGNGGLGEGIPVGSPMCGQHCLHSLSPTVMFLSPTGTRLPNFHGYVSSQQIATPPLSAPS